MAFNGGSPDADPVPFARSYQLEALEKALKQNTIVFFETGTGKTLIAIMLLRSYAHFLRKPSPYIAVFLVPTVVLVTQQGEAVAMHTDLKVGKYYGELGVDFWDDASWKCEMDEHEVLVMTPQILLNALRHRFMRLNQIKVLIFDECHNASGKHPYACIMTEFYHRKLASGNLQLPEPRVFGMTASPIKAKASSSTKGWWKQISELENLMHSKVFTCKSDSVIAQYIPISTPKVKVFDDLGIPDLTFKHISDDLLNLEIKHGNSLSIPSISQSMASSVLKNLRKLHSTFVFCLTELGIWSARKAAEVYSHEEDAFLWGWEDVSGEKVLRAFSLDAVKVFSAYMPRGEHWSISHDLATNMKEGYLTSKVKFLFEILLEYRAVTGLRCIIFVERVVTAIVICSVLNELLPGLSAWCAEYTAGNTCRMQPQSRKEQISIIEKFQQGKVNIIVATSMLEEGLDVQSCNLVIRFDLSPTICSFIQSRGRARMQNSDFVLMVKRGDSSALKRVENYLTGGDVMRNECVEHYDLACQPIDNVMHGEQFYEVERTRAIVTLGSSVSLLNFYCSRLPSDGYFKPYPRFTFDDELESCTLHLPNSCPIQPITVKQGSMKLVKHDSKKKEKLLKQLACLEACKNLHQIHALTDNLIPDIVEEEHEVQDYGYKKYLDEHAKYYPPELVGSCGKSGMLYHYYIIELKSSCQCDVELQDILLVVQTMLPPDLENMDLDFDTDRGKIIVKIKYIGQLTFSSQQAYMCQRFQITVFRVLLDHNLTKLQEELDRSSERNGSVVFNYFLLPSLQLNEKISIDWKCVNAVLYPENTTGDAHTHCFSSRARCRYMQLNSKLVCCCYLVNSIVRTPHNDYLYCITGILDDINGNTYLKHEDGQRLTYKNYYERRYGIKLNFEQESLLNAKQIFGVQNYLQRYGTPRSKERRNISYELPPELCSIVMSPISVSTLYSFSFLPSIMHRVESFLLAAIFKSMHMEQCGQNVVVPTLTILEAITTKKCQEKFHLETLETLGDSFLKYAASQQLFKTYQNRHEGLLSVRRKKLICNATLSKLGCERKFMGFIRDELFDPKAWIIPGSNFINHIIGEDVLSSRKVYIGSSRKLKSKTVADVAEALIGAYLSTGGEIAALSFMAWLGIPISLVNEPYTRNLPVNPVLHVNVQSLQSLLNYSFRNHSLLVEAVTHGSYMLPEVPVSYQRLEFLGDAVLDYVITRHLYQQYPGLCPGYLTDLRSASVNNECYAMSATKAGLYKHILHVSHVLHRQIVDYVQKFKESPVVSTFGWESEAAFPKVLADIIESLAGAIYVDSGYDTEMVFRCMRPLLEPLVTPATVRLHPVRELLEFCQREHLNLKKSVDRKNGVAHVTVEVEVNGVVLRETQSDRDKKLAEKLACKALLKSLKEIVPLC